MGACTSKSEVLKNAGEDFPVEKEEDVVVDHVAADVAEDKEAKPPQSLDSLTNQNDDVKASADKQSSEQENVTPQESEPPLTAHNKEEAVFSEENNFVEAKEEEVITKTETAVEENNVESEEKNDKTYIVSETSEANKTEQAKKEEPKPLFKLWF